MGRGERDPQGGLCPKKLPSVKTTAPATIPCTNTSPRHPVFIAPTPSSGVPHDLEMIHLLLLSRSATTGKYYSYVTATKIWSFAMHGIRTTPPSRSPSGNPSGPGEPSKRAKKKYSQLDDAVVQCGAYPRPYRVEGEALNPRGFALELGEHG